MIRLEIEDAPLSHYLEQVERGETIVLCRADVPVAEIRPLPARQPRPLGLDKGKFVVPPEFFEPLPDDLLDLFNGGGKGCD